VPRFLNEGLMLERRALQGERPALSHKSQIRDCLLYHNATVRTANDEHEVEIAVANLLDPPFAGVPPKYVAYAPGCRKILRETTFIYGMVSRRDF